MSFDTLIMKMITQELQTELAGASAQRISEPARGEIIIDFYGQGKQENLLFSIESKYARVHLTGATRKKKKNNLQPSPFCMLLRKYLIGGRAISFSNPPLERILEIEFDPPDGLPPVKLIAEIMSRRSNLILVDQNNMILGAARTVSWEKNPVRVILPGEKYEEVPPQNKLKPLDLRVDKFASQLKELISEGKKPEQALVGAVNGISPLTARELLYRTGWNINELQESSERLQNEIIKLFSAAESGNLQPVMLPSRRIYAAIPLTHLPAEEQIKVDKANEMLDRFYSRIIRDEREKALRDQLVSAVERRLAGLERKRREQNKELLATEKAPQFRLFGETLLTYGDQVPRGAESVLLPDLYKPDQKILVPLNPSKNAAANAKYYFNRYRKAKNGRDKVRKQLAITGAEIEYCRGLIYTIESGTESSLQEIRQELIEAGYLRDRQKSPRRENLLPQPLTFKTSSGRTVLVGRNNRQNDYITFKAAVRRDTWFHVRQVPGSHVVLKESPYPPPPEDCEEAAFLAAYFSKGRESSAIDVDYTEVRHVRRRPGGKPGFVFYENYETITVNPRDEKMKRMFKLDR
ncbi:MAG: NFACT family protein [Firmicutes bacterium]|nr:NFACT family protein [Bacillota bacterium]